MENLVAENLLAKLEILDWWESTKTPEQQALLKNQEEEYPPAPDCWWLTLTPFERAMEEALSLGRGLEFCRMAHRRFEQAYLSAHGMPYPSDESP